MKFPRIGLGVIIQNKEAVLLGLRANAHGHNAWAFPGGHLEFGETLEDCARREVIEETGLQIGAIQQGPYTNDIFSKEDKHYLTIFMIAEYIGGKAEVLEPDKCIRWDWFKWKDLPSPLFLPIASLLKSGFILPSCSAH